MLLLHYLITKQSQTYRSALWELRSEWSTQTVSRVSGIQGFSGLVMNYLYLNESMPIPRVSPVWLWIENNDSHFNSCMLLVLLVLSVHGGPF